ncbi:MAG: hypothetical protein HRU19_33020 [Pseudobacteriovorax sp.]|nr:hypothetical protein [Pseudobacteriovorax sp.]
MRNKKYKQEGFVLTSVLVAIALFSLMSIGIMNMTSSLKASSHRADLDVLLMDAGLYLYHNLDCNQTFNGVDCNANPKDITGRRRDGSTITNQDGTTKLGPFFVKTSCQSNDLYMYYKKEENGSWKYLVAVAKYKIPLFKGF